MTELKGEIPVAVNRDTETEIEMTMTSCLDKFSRTFEASARRWELVVYPSLLAFIVLAAYGFFLIYTLTTDVNRLARSMETIVMSMDNVVANMSAVSGNVSNISGNLTTIADEVTSNSGTMRNMLGSMDRINNSVGVMTVPMYQIRQDMQHMNQNMYEVAGPMKVLGGIMPF